MPHLNDSQQRHLVTTFRHVDRLLAGAARTLAAAASPGPFQDVVPDATPAQAKVIEESLARFREALVEALAVYGVTPPPAAGAVWSARTALLSAEIALEDLTPRGMRAYGELPEEEAAQLERIAAELTGLVRRMTRDLGAGLSRDRHDTPPARPAQAANGGAMSEKSQGCPFCEIVAGRAPAQVVEEDESSLCLLDINPLAEGHCLVISKRHVPWWHDLNDDETVSLFRMARRVARRLGAAFAPDFVCLYARGRRIPHTHLFLVPSRQGDSLDGFFNKLERFQESAPELAALKKGSRLRQAAEEIRRAREVEDGAWTGTEPA